MIHLLAETDRWALAQLCVDHVQPSKVSYFDQANGPTPYSEN